MEQCKECNSVGELYQYNKCKSCLLKEFKEKFLPLLILLDEVRKNKVVLTA
ncbi:MAG: hypothetical protein H7A25_18605 [Leptospiraceae bacterium]|nr:hypothetical protein [Leptospiraceae bacterium]